MYDSVAQAVLITFAKCNKMDDALDILPSGSLVGHCSLFGLLILGLGSLYNELPDEPVPLLEPGTNGHSLVWCGQEQHGYRCTKKVVTEGCVWFEESLS